MNKGKIVIKKVFIIITIILSSIASFSLINISRADNEQEDNNSPIGDRTFIRLKHIDNNNVEVYLEVADNTVANENDEMKSSVSVKDFQIGLDIEIDLETEGSSINFEFDDKLKDELSCQTRRATQNDIIDPTTNQKSGKRLNIYYSGNKELNDSVDTKNNTKNGIKIGTIIFEGIKEIETASIKPDSEFTKIVSVGNTLTETNILQEDGLYQILINPTVSEEDPGNQGEGSQGGSGDVEGEDQNGGSSNNQSSGNQENSGSKTDGKNPSTGDIGIKIFVVLMVVSLIGIVLLLRKKKSKHSK